MSQESRKEEKEKNGITSTAQKWMLHVKRGQKAVSLSVYSAFLVYYIACFFPLGFIRIVEPCSKQWQLSLNSFFLPYTDVISIFRGKKFLRCELFMVCL